MRVFKYRGAVSVGGGIFEDRSRPFLGCSGYANFDSFVNFLPRETFCICFVICVVLSGVQPRDWFAQLILHINRLNGSRINGNVDRQLKCYSKLSQFWEAWFEHKRKRFLRWCSVKRGKMRPLRGSWLSLVSLCTVSVLSMALGLGALFAGAAVVLAAVQTSSASDELQVTSSQSGRRLRNPLRSTRMKETPPRPAKSFPG